jgi:hypothetical protein
LIGEEADVIFMSTSFLTVCLIVIIISTSFSSIILGARGTAPVLSDWTSPTRNNLFSAFMIQPDDGWAVGSLGTVIHWDGIQWTNATTATNCTLYSVSMVNETDGWAVGLNGTIIHWNGSMWENVSGPTFADLFSICMVDSKDGWAVGQGGAIIRWDGNQWTNFTSATNNTLYSVSMVDASFGMAMGMDWILWNGTSWKGIPGAIMIPSVFSVYMIGSNDGWAVGDLGMVLHWNGTQWAEVMSSTMYVFASVFMKSATDGWAVGDIGTLVPPNYTTTVLHWDGNGWTYVGGPTTDDGWAVGRGGTIIRWNRIEWIPEFPQTVCTFLLISLTVIVLTLQKHRRIRTRA